MRKFLLLLALSTAVVISGVSTSTSIAQKKGFNYTGSTNGMAWLFRTRQGGNSIGSATQMELRTNNDQMLLIIALMNDLEEQIQNAHAASRDDGPEASEITVGEARKMVVDINVAGEEILEAILNKKQFARAKEITWQYIGYRAFDRNDFAKELKLTAKQKKEIGKLMKKSRLTDDDEDEISDVLTTAQHKRWLAMKGTAFSYFSRAKRKLPEAG